ncbi:MAG: peptidylprolyl isomerase [Patescibacteria group bacterium]
MKFKFLDKARKIKWNSKFRNIFIAGILILAVLLIAAAGVLSWGIYKLAWQGPFIEQILSIIPLPAAKVNGAYITYPEFLQNLKPAIKFYTKQKEAGFGNIPTPEQLKKIVLEDRLVVNILVKQIAKRYNITVSPAEIEAKTQEIIQNKGSQAEVEKFLQDYYGLSLEEYKKIFIVPNLYYDQTSGAVIDDENINGAAKNKIQEALSKLRDGEAFEEAAKTYSEDPLATNNASQENFLRGELPKDIEDQLFAMSAGEFTDVLTLPNSYAILKLEQKDEDKGVLTVRKIIVKIKILDDLIQAEKQKSKIEIYAY